MYNYHITAQETADYIADMLEMQAEAFAPPTEEEMAEMAAYFGEA